MKVGIVTFHHAHNFGAVLQCLALKTIVSDLGHDATVIPHINKRIANAYRLHNPLYQIKHGLFSCLKSCIGFSATLIPKTKRIKKFNSFIERYLLDSNIKDDSCKDYDCIIYGSDQIWRAGLTDNDLFYWGKSDGNNVKKISYAASAGVIEENFKTNIELLKDFSAISVREAELNDYLINKDFDTQLSLDPTLLLDRKRWSEIIPIKSHMDKPYILVYAMRNKDKVLKVAEDISKKENLQIKEILNNNMSWREALMEYNDGDPLDFISLIHNATYVVTDSFHGTVFSIIFNKQFVTVELKDGHDNRAKSLLASLNIENRMSETGSTYNEKINYNEVDLKLSALKQDSIKFLTKALTPQHLHELE